jgi:hypothetical protein
MRCSPIIHKAKWRFVFIFKHILKILMVKTVPRTMAIIAKAKLNIALVSLLSLSRRWHPLRNLGRRNTTPHRTRPWLALNLRRIDIFGALVRPGAEQPAEVGQPP